MQTPTQDQLRKIGRYWSQTDSTKVREWKQDYGFRTLTDIGQHIFECDPEGFWRSMEEA